MTQNGNNFKCFAIWGDSLIPIKLINCFTSVVTGFKTVTVESINGKPFTDGHHKYPVHSEFKTLPANKILVVDESQVQQP